MRPSALTNAIFLFVLALAAQRSGVVIHAFCVMSNQSDFTDVRRSPGPAGGLSGSPGPLAGAPLTTAATAGCPASPHSGIFANGSI